MSSNLPGRVCSLALVLVGAGCATGRVPWVEDGVERGTIRITAAGSGERHAYHDRKNRLVRIEYRTETGALDPERAIEHREYDARGRVHHLYFTGVDGARTSGPGGFATRRLRVENRKAGRRLHYEYFDAGDRPTTIDAGYFRETLTHDRGRLLHRKFYDTEGRPAGAKVGEWKGVHEIRYAYLKGVTPIVMEMLVDGDGEPMHKRKLSGRTELWIENWWGYYGVYGTYPVYGGRRVRPR